jgi:hypothetical protein
MVSSDTLKRESDKFEIEPQIHKIKDEITLYNDRE